MSLSGCRKMAVAELFDFLLMEYFSSTMQLTIIVTLQFWATVRISQVLRTGEYVLRLEAEQLDLARISELRRQMQIPGPRD